MIVYLKIHQDTWKLSVPFDTRYATPMSIQENPEKRNDETVTLVLKNERVKVKKQLLICKSKYFASLLSLNFKDHQQEEHIINYDISWYSLQDFVKWVNEDQSYVLETESRLVKYCLGKYTHYNLDDLLRLLNLSVLFIVDQLTEDIIDVIERCWLQPQHVIQIWIVARDLSIHILEDISLAVCLDQFAALPVEQVVKLPCIEFKKLVGNINLISTTEYLQDIVSKWNKYNDETLSVNVQERKKQKFVSSIIGLEDPRNNDSKIHLFCWDDKKFYEQSAFNYPKEILNELPLNGMRCTGRGFDIYFCGGEYGLGTGRFNKKLWRYSLLSKRWYCLSFIPTPRRHMIFVAVQNKLLLVAGTGQFRIKLSKMDIYNIHTQTWSKGMDLFETFSSIPDYCVTTDKLIIYIPSCGRFYIYLVNKNIWCTVTPSIGPLSDMCLQFHVPLIEYGFNTCYLDARTKTDSGKVLLAMINGNDTVSPKCQDQGGYNDGKCEEIQLSVSNSEFMRSCGSLFYGKLLNDNYILLLMPDKCVPASLHVHSLYVEIPCLLITDSPFIKRFFHMINLADLHTESNIFECDKIDCNKAQNSSPQDCKPSTSDNHPLSNHLLDKHSSSNLSCNSSQFTDQVTDQLIDQVTY